MRLTALSFSLPFRLLPVLALVALTLVMAGCGIKPAKLSPPPGVSKDSYPKTYPDPSTDPQPKSKKPEPESTIEP